MGLTLHQSGHGHSHDPSQQQENPSVRAAFIHVIGDLLQSLGVLVAAYILYFKVRAGDRGTWVGWGRAGKCRSSGGFSLHRTLQILAHSQLWMDGWGEGKNIQLLTFIITL